MSGTGSRLAVRGGRSPRSRGDGRPRTTRLRNITESIPVAVSDDNLQAYERRRVVLREFFEAANQRAADAINDYQAKVIKLKAQLETKEKKKAKYEQEKTDSDKKIQELEDLLKSIQREVKQLKLECQKMESKSAVGFGAAPEATMNVKKQLKQLEDRKHLISFEQMLHKQYRTCVSAHLTRIEPLVHRYRQLIIEYEVLIDQRDEFRDEQNQEILRRSISWRRRYLGIRN